MARNINLDALSAQELNELIKDATGKRDEKMEDAKRALMDEMESRAAALGMSLEGLLGERSKPGATSKTRKLRKDAGTPVPAKYRGPEGEEWTGRGRPPNWLSTLEGQGRNREAFRI